MDKRFKTDNKASNKILIKKKKIKPKQRKLKEFEKLNDKKINYSKYSKLSRPKKRRIRKYLRKGSNEITELDIKLSNIKEKLILILVAFFVIYNIVIIYQKATNPESIPDFFGYKTFVVSSGSMEPNLNVGDLIITENSLNINKGDIITFFDEEKSVVTHRVIEVIELNGEKKYRTKGDANSTEDKYIVSESDIEGRFKQKIPIIGWAVHIIQTREGIILTSVILFAIYWYIKTGEENEEEWNQLLDDLLL